MVLNLYNNDKVGLVFKKHLCWNYCASSEGKIKTKQNTNKPNKNQTKNQHQIPQTLRLGMVLSIFAVFELQKLDKVINERGDSPCLKSVILKQFLIVSLVSGLKLLLTDQLRRSPVVQMSLLLFNWLVRKLLLNQPLSECESKVLQSFLYMWAQVIFKWLFALCVWTVRWSSQWKGRYHVCSSNCSLLQLEGRTLCTWVLETGKWVLTSQVIPQLQAVKRGAGKEMNLAAISERVVLTNTCSVFFWLLLFL